jgi:hypothetical protein
MHTTSKKILFGIGIFGSIIVGIVMLIMIYPAIYESIPDTHLEGDATDTEIAKFDEHYEDFERIATFIVQACKDTNKDVTDAGGRTFTVDVNAGNITYASLEKDPQGYNYRVPFKSDEAVKQSVNSLNSYYGTNQDIYINVSGSTVRFIHYLERVVYSPDNSVPTYAYHPRELASSYSAYNLRNNWYLVKNTTPYPGT